MTKMTKLKTKLLTAFVVAALAPMALAGKAEAAGSSTADATPLPIGQTGSETLSGSGYVDRYYQVALTRSGLLRLTTSVSEDWTYVYILDSTGKDVDYEIVKAQNGQVVISENLVAGTYFVKMHTYVTNKHTNSYSIKTSFAAGVETYPETAAKRDNTDATANAVNFGTTYRGFIAENDTIDTYKVSVSQDSVIRMSVSGEMKSLSFDFYDANGKSVKNNYAYPATGSATISMNFRAFTLKKGTYFLRVNTSKSYPGNYAFSMNRTNLGWNKDSKGWSYQYEDGSYAKNKWVKVGKKEYRFNAAGYMMTGWKKIDKQWYYLDKKSGAMATGWKKLGGKWYYFHKEYGYMFTGYRDIGNKTYFFADSGAMKTGWIKPYGSTWHYFASSGAECYGWQKIGGKWYYFSKSGSMYYGGRYNINGKTYRFSDSGVCLNP